MGNVSSSNKKCGVILYRDIKSRIKERKKLNKNHNIYLDERKDKNLHELNKTIIDFYNEMHEEFDFKKIEEEEATERERENKESVPVKIKFRKVRIEHESNHIDKGNSEINKMNLNDEVEEIQMVNIRRVTPNPEKVENWIHKKKTESIETTTTAKTSKKKTNNMSESAEFNYSSFYSVDELKKENNKNNNAISNKNEHKNKNKTNNQQIVEKEKHTDKKVRSSKEKEKKNESKREDEVHKINERNHKDKNHDPPITIHQINQMSQKSSKDFCKNPNNIHTNHVDFYDDNMTNTTIMKPEKKQINGDLHLHEKKKKYIDPLVPLREQSNSITNRTRLKQKNKNSTKKLFKLIKKKTILETMLQFLNCNEILSFQRTCSTVYISISDFLDYICLHLFNKFQKKYQPYFTPFNYYYKYEYLYTYRPSYRLDCIIIAEINKECAGFNNRFGYKYNYIYDKHKNHYNVFFNFNVLKKNSPRTIEIHKDISYNNGDDINVSLIHEPDVCVQDFICIPINLYNVLGTVDFNGISFINNKITPPITHTNNFDDQLWYEAKEYQSLLKDTIISNHQSLDPYLKHINTIYSGIDITIMKSTYKAIKSGTLGKKGYYLWGNYFIIKEKHEPIFIFLKREGLQHDYIYHNFYLRVGDKVIFFLIKGGNYN